MKHILLGALALLTLNVNGQKIMKNPEQTVIGLFVATDQKDWRMVEQYFSDEVLLDYSSMNGNPATHLSPQQIITAWKGILPGFESTHHQVGNITSTIDKNKAKVFCYGTASHHLSDEQGSLWTVVGTYDFELEKTRDEWQITSMKFNFKFQDANTSLPEKAINNLK